MVMNQLLKIVTTTKKRIKMSNTTQDHNSTIKDHFSGLFEIFEQNLNGKSKLEAHQQRKAAIRKFQDADFPTRRDEDWKYTSVARIVEPQYQLGIPFQSTKEQIAKYQFSGLDAYTLVFTNGVFQEELSTLPTIDSNVVIQSLDRALQEEQYKTIINQQLEQSPSEAMATFVALNEAFARHGFFIHVKRKVAQEKPVHFIYLTNTESDILVSPRIIAHIEDNSEFTIIESYHALNNHSYFVNGANNFSVGANSHLHHYKIQIDNTSAYRINDTVVTQQQDSTYSNYTADLGGKIVRNNLSSILKASGTMTNFFGVYLPQGDQHVDNQTFIDHAFPHCNSNELYKGVIKDKGRGVFNGKVLVRQDAQKTNAYQQNSTLVLSDKAMMDTKPQLEIFADDVRCSHGATVGQLDEESVYYLKARGLNDDQARSLLQFAFIGEVIENFQLKEIREKVSEMVMEKLQGL